MKFVWLRSGDQWSLLGSGKQFGMIDKPNSPLHFAWSAEDELPEKHCLDLRKWDGHVLVGQNDTIVISKSAEPPARY